jgi:hypothetical protein
MMGILGNSCFPLAVREALGKREPRFGAAPMFGAPRGNNARAGLLRRAKVPGLVIHQRRIVVSALDLGEHATFSRNLNLD